MMSLLVVLPVNNSRSY